MKKPSRKIFFELRAETVGGTGERRMVHCLLEFQHAPFADRRVCWLQAVVLAQETLRRVPTAEELRPVTAKAAARLLETLEGQGGRRGPLFLLAA